MCVVVPVCSIRVWVRGESIGRGFVGKRIRNLLEDHWNIGARGDLHWRSPLIARGKKGRSTDESG